MFSIIPSTLSYMVLAEAQAAPPPDPIADLIAAGEHRKALIQCADRHGAALGRMCMALLGSQSDAEEVVQETLIAAHQGMASYRGDGSVRAWLFGIARRQCARFLERKRRDQTHLRIVPDETDGTPERAIAIKRRAQAVRAALARLKPSEREALVLRYQAGLSFREIGRACRIEEAAARKRASRGLHNLRKLITREVVE